MTHSRRQGWHTLSPAQRVVDLLQELAASPEETREIESALAQGGLTLDDAGALSENVLGIYALPFSIVPNFIINGRDCFLPAVTEEPSVVAALGNAARWARSGGGFTVQLDPPLMVGQIEVLCADPVALGAQIMADEAQWRQRAKGTDPQLEALGGGLLSLATRPLLEAETARPLLLVELLIDVREAMGANAVNSYAEKLGALLAQTYDVAIGPRILSNLCDRRLARAQVTIPVSAFAADEAQGLAIARAIESASRFAESDAYRAATHNKGIMNGVDAVLLACGQDWRAVEAGAHAYAARAGRYTALSRWRLNGTQLCGELCLPLAVGVVGGAGRRQKLARLARRLSEVETAADLATRVAAAGLAANLAALRALSQEGIQTGHMRLHRRGGA